MPRRNRNPINSDQSSRDNAPINDTVQLTDSEKISWLLWFILFIPSFFVPNLLQDFQKLKGLQKSQVKFNKEVSDTKIELDRQKKYLENETIKLERYEKNLQEKQEEWNKEQTDLKVKLQEERNKEEANLKEKSQEIEKQRKTLNDKEDNLKDEVKIQVQQIKEEQLIIWKKEFETSCQEQIATYTKLIESYNQEVDERKNVNAQLTTTLKEIKADIESASKDFSNLQQEQKKLQEAIAKTREFANKPENFGILGVIINQQNKMTKELLEHEQKNTEKNLAFLSKVVQENSQQVSNLQNTMVTTTSNLMKNTETVLETVGNIHENSTKVMQKMWKSSQKTEAERLRLQKELEQSRIESEKTREHMRLEYDVAKNKIQAEKEIAVKRAEAHTKKEIKIEQIAASRAVAQLEADRKMHKKELEVQGKRFEKLYDLERKRLKLEHAREENANRPSLIMQRSTFGPSQRTLASLSRRAISDGTRNSSVVVEEIRDENEYAEDKRVDQIRMGHH